jgi:hypothetical protein
LPRKSVSSVSESLQKKGINFLSLKRRGFEKPLQKWIALQTLNFIKANYPQSDLVNTPVIFSQNILENKQDWKRDDIILFFKFFLLNSHLEELKVYGSSFTITPAILFKAVSLFEQEKSAYRESIHKSNHIAIPSDEKRAEPEQVKEIVKGILHKTYGEIVKGWRTPSIFPEQIKAAENFDPVLSKADYNVFIKSIPTLKKEYKLSWIAQLEKIKYGVDSGEEKIKNELLNLLTA